MQAQSFANPAGWGIVLYGLGLACLAAMTPFFHAGYYLHTGVFIAGISPYLVYAIAVPLLPGAITTSAGLILISAHTGLVAAERFIDKADYSDGMIYAMPLLLAVLMVPLAIYAVIKTDAHRVIPGPTEEADTEE